jgi:micrococcal nuclease
VLRALALLAFGLAITPAAAHAATALEATVLRVVDGDTVHVRVGERVEKVRYIGVNTPELHHPRKGEEPGGREAHAVNRRLVEGRRVRLELDVQSHDRHGRLLAYVWAGETMVNAELVRLGYAQVMTVPPNVRHQALFLKLQREARDARRGLWRQAAARGPSASLAPSHLDLWPAACPTS